MPRLIAAATLLALVSLPCIALADEAEVHSSRAKTLFETGKLDQAIKEYTRAYEINPRPKYLYNMGMCHLKLGKLEDLKRARINFMACGRKARGKLKTTAEDQIKRVDTLIAQAEEAQKAAARPAPRSTTSKRSRRIPLWTIITGAGAVAAAGVGIGMGLAARSSWEEYQVTEDEERYEELRDDITAKSAVANISYGVAGALAIAAITIYVLMERHPEEEQQQEARIRVSPAGVAMSFDLF